MPWTVAIRTGSGESLAQSGHSTPSPTVHIIDEPHAITLVFDAAGASPDNVELVWNEQANLFHFAVHANRLRSVAEPPDLIWYRTHWLPVCCIEGAAAKIKRGRVTVMLPKQAAELSTVE